MARWHNTKGWQAWPWSGGRWQTSGWTTPTDIPAAEADALKNLYEATSGPSWTNSTNWGTTATADDWYGVTVTAGHVTGLSLANNALSGDVGATVPTTTETLDLGQNTGITDIDVSGLTSADNIDLAGCGFGQTVVAGILADVVTAAVSGGTLDIGGTNSAPTPSGVSSLQTLEDDSWTLTYSTVVMENTGSFYVATAAGSAAFRSTATDLSGQTGKYLVLKDSAGKYAEAYIDAADTAEAFGADLLSGIDLTSGWSTISATINDANTFTSTADLGRVYKSIVSPGLLYLSSMGISVSSGNADVYIYDATNFAVFVEDTTTGYSNIYKTSTGTLFIIKNNISGTVTDINSSSLKQVTHLGTDAVVLESTAGGGDGTFTDIESGFNPNNLEKVEVFNP